MAQPRRETAEDRNKKAAAALEVERRATAMAEFEVLRKREPGSGVGDGKTYAAPKTIEVAPAAPAADKTVKKGGTVQERQRTLDEITKLADGGKVSRDSGGLSFPKKGK